MSRGAERLGAALLDHVSLAAPRTLLEDGGFTVTPTLGAERAHARVLLEGGYLELTPGDAMVAGGWFARPATGGVGRWHDAARAAGLPVLAPEVYRGADGVWLDVAFGGPDAHPALPVVTERTAPAELASAWPPPASRHANAAHGIARIDIEAEDPERLTELLRRTAGAAPGESDDEGEGGDIRFGNGTVRVRPAGPAGTRIAAVIIERAPAASTAPTRATTDDPRVVIDDREIRLLPQPK
jgi:hypothetical protein